jgi:predicted transcriptional regulator
MELQQISESELVLMRIIWDKGGIAMFAEIMAELERQGRAFKNNTTLTLLSRLIEKKYLKTSKMGRRNIYGVRVSQETYNAAQTKILLDKVYEGSVKGLVNTLLSQGLVSEEEKEALRLFWKEAEKDA